MNNKSLVRISNIIAIVSIILLFYWVFIFITISVFEFKIFKENITQTFYLSVFGILSLMAGSLILNVMFNLTRIAEKHNQDQIINPNYNIKKVGVAIGLTFPLLFGILYFGDYQTKKKKEKMLISSARSIIEQNIEKSNKLLNYSFSKGWIIETSETLELYSNTDKYLPDVTVIVFDSINNSRVFLGFGEYYSLNPPSIDEEFNPKKIDFIHKTSKEEREYLDKVFNNNENKIRFSANDGNYELFYPYTKNGKKIILLFSDYQKYGKIGS